MEKKAKILFVCVENSARSQMAEAWLNHLAGDRFQAESAGLEPGVLNPLAVAVMKEEGIDISGKQTRSVFDVFTSGALFSYVITVCDQKAAERCPVFPGVVEREHWSFADPGAVEGSDEEKLAKVRGIRDEIRSTIEQWLEKVSAA